jgi:hypothetical protein
MDSILIKKFSDRINQPSLKKLRPGRQDIQDFFQAFRMKA